MRRPEKDKAPSAWDSYAKLGQKIAEMERERQETLAALSFGALLDERDRCIREEARHEMTRAGKAQGPSFSLRSVRAEIEVREERMRDKERYGDPERPFGAALDDWNSDEDRTYDGLEEQ